MSLYSEQFEQRIKLDDEMFADACERMADAAVGKRFFRASQNDLEDIKSVIDEIFKFYSVKPREIPEEITDINEQLEFAVRGTGIMRRAVTLTGAWYKDAVGAMLGSKADGTAVALLPKKLGGYSYRDPISGALVTLDKTTAQSISRQAICFYRPLPLKRLNNKDLFRYIARCLSARDALAVLALTLLSALLMLVTPAVSRALYAGAQTGAEPSLLAALAAPLLSAIIAKALFDMTKSVAVSRVITKANAATQSACMMRLLSEPAGFFKEYSSGELASRTNGVATLCGDLAVCVTTFVLTPVFSLVLLPQMAKYGAALMLPALLTLLALAAVAAIDTVMRTGLALRASPLAAKEEGVTHAFLSGVEKVKLAGAEKRAFSRWADAYSSHAALTYNPPRLLKVTSALTLAATLAGTLAIYGCALSAGVRLPEYIAFSAAFGMLAGAFSSLSGMTASVARISSSLAMLKPLLSAAPEVSETRKLVTELSGLVEMSNVTFRYDESAQPVINDLSLKINAGEYVAVVGSTGCGKSTLIRLLLGLETPQRGSIYYDGQDIADLDVCSLRRRIGIVLQNDALFQGDVYSNIVVTAPWLTPDDAWRAAEIAGIADDIRDMPMGMNTVLSEGGGGISGGQKQRLMIARAVAGSPSILIFDEATNALDNNTQKKVTDALDSLKCTRIVVAHRLSTIRRCERILVLDNGRFIEEGNYDELIAKNGAFAELVARQRA